ncbi:MAG: hypothetical protein WD928_10200 [Gammaproteobacteria bacterium]
MMGRLPLLLSGVVTGVLIAIAIGWSTGQRAARDQEDDAEQSASAAASVPDAAERDADDDAGPARLTLVDGRRRLVLDAADVTLAGIASETLEVVEVTPERPVPGTVIDSAALRAAQRARLAAQAAREAQTATAMVLQERVRRLSSLAADTQLGVGRELAELELQWRREIERSVALEAEFARLDQLVEARWGPSLARASRPDSELDRALADGAVALVEFAAARETPHARAAVAAGGDRGSARAATLVGAAPQVLPDQPGATWYARVDAAGLRRGMRVDVWLPRDATPLRGWYLPDSALVWHGGRRWFFVALDGGTFERHSLPEDAVAHGAGVILSTPSAGEEIRVVTQGAQTLLAEEFRGAIPDEDED